MPSRLIQSRSAAGTTLTSSSTETVWDYCALPAGSFANGKQIRMSGIALITAETGGDTLTVKAYQHSAAAIASGTALATSGAVDMVVNDTVSWDICFSPYSAAGSTSGTIIVHGWMTVVGTEGTVTARAVYQKLTSVDFTAVQYIGITGKHSTTSASDSSNLEAFDVVEIF